MYVCMYGCVCVCVSMYVRVHVYVCVHVRMVMCEYVRVCVFMYLSEVAMVVTLHLVIEHFALLRV